MNGLKTRLFPLEREGERRSPYHEYWYDCEGNDDTWEDAGLTDYIRWYAQTRDRLKDERPEVVMVVFWQ